MSTHSVVDNEKEESRSTTYLKKGVMKIDEKKETTPTIVMRKR
jgi:hypothetical protein